MRALTKPPRRKPEPTIALINIVFLMLVFFLVAGTVAAPLDPGLTLVKVADLDQTPPPDALVIAADGRLSHRGVELTSPSAFMSRQDALKTVRLLPDRDLPARALVAIAGELKAAGADQILIITERGLP